ncbi:serine protease [Patescibacteria group bacterium]|nr:serine protease [Patescibacteria group bacterium]MBU1922279.1 serine protease [Patescibacteria group bacterium]
MYNPKIICSIFRLYEDNNEDTAYYGTAVAIGNGYFLTAGHCVTQSRKKKWICCRRTEYAAHLIKKWRKRDIALMRAPGLGGRIKELTIATDLPQDGERVHIYSMPGSSQYHKKIYLSGFADSLHQKNSMIEVAVEDRYKNPYIRYEGASGGAVINDQGKLFGLFVASEKKIHQFSHRSVIPKNPTSRALLRSLFNIRKTVHWLTVTLLTDIMYDLKEMNVIG